MKYIVDTNVLSETTKPDPDPAVISWLLKHEAEMVVNPMILGELRYGILLMPVGKRRNELERWFEQGVTKLECVPIDATTGLRWAELIASLKKSGQLMPLKDSMIAATALTHELTVVTRNGSDFEKAGVKVMNPFGKG